MRPTERRRALTPWDGLFILGYLLEHWPALFYIKDFSWAIFPLVSLYVARAVFGHGLSPALATIPISPTNIFFIWPPGAWWAAYVLGSVRHMYLFLFFVQLPVPFLLFRLLRRHLPQWAAGLLSLAAIHFFVNTHWWSPDWMVQPLLLASALFVRTDRSGPEQPLRLVAAGGVIGLAMVFKHNAGLFSIVALLVFVWLRCLKRSGAEQGPLEPFFRWLPVAGCGGFAAAFALRVPHFDEIAYYSIPCVMFWLAVGYWLRRRPDVRLDLRAWTKGTACLLAGFIPVPAAVFGTIGARVGAARYFYSLFGMGFKFISIWDAGIVVLLQRYLGHLPSAGLGAVGNLYRGGAYLLLFALPPAATLSAAWWCWDRARAVTQGVEEEGRVLAGCSLAVIGSFMLFPLEAYHILATKLFLALLALSLLGEAGMRKLLLGTVAACALFLLPPALRAAPRSLREHLNGAPGSTAMARYIGVPLDPRLSNALEGQVEVLQHVTSGSPYFVVDTSGEVLASLMALVDNPLPQFSIEMRNGILDSGSRDAILRAMDSASYLVMNEDDYQRHAAGADPNPYVASIVAHAEERFVTVARYRPPADLPPSSQIYGFRVMALKAPKGNIGKS